MESLALSIADAAAVVGYGTTTIREAIDKGDIIPRYANRKPVIPVSELKAWLDRLPTEPPSR